MIRWNPFNRRIGIALGGGGARGLAHIGVLQAFEDAKVPIYCISGTSVGAIVASYYAFGKDFHEIERLGDRLSVHNILKLKLAKKGFASTDSIRKMLLDDLGDVQIQKAKIPLAICATDIQAGVPVIFRSGSLLDAVCASVAVPGVFAPVLVNGRLLVDGGITENVPIDVLERMGAGVTVGVDLSAVQNYPKVNHVFDVLANAIDIAIDLRTRQQLKKADIPISLDLSGFSRFDNSEQKEELIAEGHKKARQQISKLLWYRNTQVYHTLARIFTQVIPIKVPEIWKVIFRWKKQASEMVIFEKKKR